MPDPTHLLRAGDLLARILPERGMLVASLRHRGLELLRRIDDLDGAAARGSTAGIPLLHPWANRLASPRFRVAGREVSIDPASPLVHLDGNGLLIHGVPWSRLQWRIERADDTGISAILDWTNPDLLAVFPFPHRLNMAIVLTPRALVVHTTIVAGADGPVPVSFGFHPYLGLPSPRATWRLTLPTMGRIGLDARGIPTGSRSDFPGLDAPLGARTFDDGFALDGDGAVLAISDDSLRLAIELVEGFPFCQVFAPPGDACVALEPPGHACVALEPMTAPADALVTGRDLRILDPGATMRTTFRVSVEPLARPGSP